LVLLLRLRDSQIIGGILIWVHQGGGKSGIIFGLVAGKFNKKSESGVNKI
jgi:hypothetical protein